MGVRRNQKNMSPTQWTAFIDAIRSTHGTTAAAPAYRRFVSVHVAAFQPAKMNWGVHTMQMGGMLMRGRNFLAWHRRLLKRFEERLQMVNATVTVLSWDSITDPNIPLVLADPNLLAEL